MLVSVMWLKRRSNYLAVPQATEPEVGMLRFGSKRSGNPLKEFRMERGLWRRDALPAIYHSCLSYTYMGIGTPLVKVHHFVPGIHSND